MACEGTIRGPGCQTLLTGRERKTRTLFTIQQRMFEFQEAGGGGRDGRLGVRETGAPHVNSRGGLTTTTAFLERFDIVGGGDAFGAFGLAIG